MTSLDHFKSLVREFHDVADFLIIYIQEAHPLDEWNITGHQYSHLRQHVNLQERVTAASLLDSHVLPCPIAVDPMDNKATLLYSAVPKRLYVIQEGVVRYAGGMGTHRYRLKHIDHWLQKYKKSQATHANQNDEDKIENDKLD
ncbi:Type III iodothyronine deiodinase [Mizuhopecten yessoensis]|uniref:Iodothyronine deiodinase n=1 Tax=Mizuhopecten yessoensis TaxID=6573 RepID=A0A210PRG2_MIZYE|nr:Type III iodothyronine deiodinase [Mizuhopecten yessoensis]